MRVHLAMIANKSHDIVFNQKEVRFKTEMRSQIALTLSSRL